jgi:hypothetical protein
MAGNTEYGMSKLIGWMVLGAIFVAFFYLITVDQWVKWAFFAIAMIVLLRKLGGK